MSGMAWDYYEGGEINNQCDDRARPDLTEPNVAKASGLVNRLTREFL